MSISEIGLYKALRIKLGDETANELVEFVTSEVKTELDNKTNLFLTKEDKIDLIEKMNADKTELLEKMNLLAEKMNKDKIDLIKWMVGLWVSAIGLLIAVLKFI
ncbi:MAG: hypothetical protein ACR2FN_11905 [Chitinophagaceae bacterium]